MVRYGDRVSEFGARSADLMLSVFNLGALDPARAAIRSTRPPRELDLCSDKGLVSVDLEPNTASSCAVGFEVEFSGHNELFLSWQKGLLSSSTYRRL